MQVDIFCASFILSAIFFSLPDIRGYYIIIERKGP